MSLQELGLSTQQQHVAPLYQHMFPPSECNRLLPWAMHLRADGCNTLVQPTSVSESSLLQPRLWLAPY